MEIVMISMGMGDVAVIMSFYELHLALFARKDGTGRN